MHIYFQIIYYVNSLGKVKNKAEVEYIVWWGCYLITWTISSIFLSLLCIIMCIMYNFFSIVPSQVPFVYFTQNIFLLLFFFSWRKKNLNCTTFILGGVVLIFSDFSLANPYCFLKGQLKKKNIYWEEADITEDRIGAQDDATLYYISGDLYYRHYYYEDYYY